MQQLIYRFLADLTQAVELPDPVFEFGALQVEDDQHSDLRPLFAGRPFIGVDFRPGPGVDRVDDLRALSLPEAEVGTAICLDTLEHCDDPVQACRELHRVVADQGVCVISSVMLFGIHAYPNDYFRFTPEAFRSMLAAFDDVSVAAIGMPEYPMQVIGVAAKGRKLGLSMDRLPSLAAAQAWWDSAPGRVRLAPMLYPPGELLRALARDLPRLTQDRLARRFRA